MPPTVKNAPNQALDNLQRGANAIAAQKIAENIFGTNANAAVYSMRKARAAHPDVRSVEAEAALE